MSLNFSQDSDRNAPRLSRRTVLHGLAGAGALCATGSYAELMRKGTARILLGNGKGEGIYQAVWNPEQGSIEGTTLAIKASKPSFLIKHPRLPVIYCCNEDDAPAAAISAFRYDPHASEFALQPLASEPTNGSAPCFVSLDPTSRLLFAANYSGGSLAAFPLDAAGKPAPADVFSCKDTKNSSVCGALGPVKDRQEAAHLHCANLSPDGHHVLACNLGGDTILVFPIHPGTRQPLGEPVAIRTRTGAGPRHLAFHPTGRFLYCINELDCTVVAYRWSPSSKALATPIQDGSVSILPPGAPANVTSTGAELAITRDGRFLYASTRFTDVLTVFRIDAQTGRLTQLQQLPCGGKTPRFFALDPTERWLLCANQDSDTITTFSRNAQTGQLTPKATYPATNPQCILWL